MNSGQALYHLSHSVSPILPGFAIASQTEKFMATVCDNCLVIYLPSYYHVGIVFSHIITRKRRLSTVPEDILKKGRPHSHNFYYSIFL
jgi:hypothetical protein